MESNSRTYLDNAATSWPKPAQVIAATSDFYQSHGGAAGRSGHAAGSKSDSIVANSRRALAELVHSGRDDYIVFAHNGTDALNMAIHGLVKPRDHIIVSSLEHNSVLRPVAFCRDQKQATVTRIGTTSEGIVDLKELQAAIQPHTSLVCLTHASNVTGVIQPVELVGAICRRHSINFLIDAAQTVGHVPIDVASFQCDVLAAAGHKGLFGPLGTGFLFVSQRVAEVIVPYRQGGTGTHSHSEYSPTELPGRLESGNLNVGGIAGLLSGLEFVRKTGIANIAAHGQSLLEQLKSSLDGVDQIRWIAGANKQRVPIASLIFDNWDVHELAAILDSTFGIQVRAGLHCAPNAVLDGNSNHGLPTLRLSPGWFTTVEEIDNATAAMRKICG
jgi:cysteine desulfurase family protein